MKKFILVLMSVLLLTGCSNTTTTKIESKRVNSYDNKFQVTVPASWDTPVSKGSLNQAANIEIQNSEKQKYMIAITEAKADLAMDFEKYQETIFSQNEENYNTKFEEIKDININEKNCKYVEFKTTQETTNIYMRIYAIETDNYYSQILMWTTYSQKEDVQKEFDKIISSFKETK